MKILYVYGDDDYGAVNFEDSNYTVEDVVKMVEEEGQDEFETDDGDSFFAEVLNFKDVDPEFITWVKNTIQDYDDSKNKDFYIVGE
jgi:hypothetical protein